MGLFGVNRLKGIYISLFLTSVIAGSKCDGEVDNLPICGPNNLDEVPSKNLLFISTLDGQVTALDSRDGTAKWHLQAGQALLSSSIHRLELNNGGQLVRLVPSLGGSLYRFSGDSLEPLPLSADQLLSSSHKYSDDLVIAGGKETASIGVSTRTGKVVYECSLHGCVNATGPTGRSDQLREDLGELLLIRRVTQTVRAIEPRSGQERWNFSVGQHELNLQPFKGCVLPTPIKSVDSDLIYKVVVPEGLVCAVQRSAPHNVVWKHKLNTPIVAAWDTVGNQLHSIDLFGATVIPSWAFSSITDTPDGSSADSAPLINPAVYIGMHNRQLYIQESVRMQALVQSHSNSRPALGHDHHHHRLNSLVIPWRPIPARFPHSDPTDSETAIASINEEYSTTSLSVLYASEYVNGNGYYLYTDYDIKILEDPTCDMNKSLIEGGESNNNRDSGKPLLQIEGPEEEDIEWTGNEPIDLLARSLWYWWKEVAIIAISTAVCVNLLSHHFRRRFSSPEIHRHYVVVERPVLNIVTQPSITATPSLESTPSMFSSRYLNDFTPLKCLGRGGFGIVFEARNKIDDCSYALKRITLPYKKDKRDKVLREVRALAKLEHGHIVRYFNAWLEEPPLGWEDPFERELKTEIDFTETYSKVPSISNLNNNNKSLNVDLKNKNVCLSIQPDLMKECDSKITKNICFNNQISLDFSRQRSYSMNDSFSVVFEKSFKRNSSKNSNSKSYSREDDEYSKSFMKNNDDDDDEDSFVIFAEPDKTTDKSKAGDSIISISDSDFQVKSRDNHSNSTANVKETKFVCINESQEYKKKRGHRKNLSLDLQNLPRKPVEPLGRMYLYIQMQLCKPESLRDWLRDNTCPDVRKTEVVSIFEQIVQAVEYVHLQGLIHRDLKPSNIFFSIDGRIKIGDFGLVTAMTDPLTMGTEPARSPILGMPDVAHDKHTKHVGTHLYMSPEQLRGEAHGYKVDIWSLGLVLAELLIPFGTEMERIMALKAIREHRFPKGFDTNFPQEYSLLRLMLSPKPEQRPSTLGVRARAPLLHRTDHRYHFCLPPRHSHHSSSSTSSN